MNRKVNNNNNDNKIFNDNTINLERELDLCIRPPRDPLLSHSIIESRFELGFSRKTCIFSSVMKPDVCKAVT